MTRRYLLILLAMGLSLATSPVGAWTVEELAETFCDYYDGVSCNFEEIEGAYKFGPHSLLTGGNGKLRAEAAYCLLRDGDGEKADGTLGEDWYQFGAVSRVHVTHAGRDPATLLRLDSQHMTDLVLFGKTLTGVGSQELLTTFPIEAATPQKKGCKKWAQVGSQKVCAQYQPVWSDRRGYYMTLKTEAYGWEIDLDEVAGDLSTLFGGPPLPEGLEVALGQDVPFEYYGTTALGGTDLILNDGQIPSIAYSGNLWEWGVSPAAGDRDSLYLTIELPIVSTQFASLTLDGGILLDSYYALEEGPFYGDPDAGITDTPPPIDELTTSTHLEAGTDIELTLAACIDFGWFGEWCGDFLIVDLEDVAERDPLNQIAYTPRGQPLSSQWSDGTDSVAAGDVYEEITSCLNAATIEQESQETASPADWSQFFTDVGEEVDEHYGPCQITEPQNTVTIVEPSFKICDDRGNVYEPLGGFTKKITQAGVRGRGGR
jgi:hypothetical protein